VPNPFSNPRFRAAVYALAAAAFAVAGIYDLLTEEQSAAWLNVVGTGIAVLALVNIPKGGAEE
jgi:hypothetical protein